MRSAIAPFTAATTNETPATPLMSAIWMSAVCANWPEPSGYAPIAPIESRMRSHSAATQVTGNSNASGQRKRW